MFSDYIKFRAIAGYAKKLNQLHKKLVSIKLNSKGQFVLACGNFRITIKYLTINRKSPYTLCSDNTLPVTYMTSSESNHAPAFERLILSIQHNITKWAVPY